MHNIEPYHAATVHVYTYIHAYRVCVCVCARTHTHTYTHTLYTEVVPLCIRCVRTHIRHTHTHSLDAVTPGETLGTLYASGVGTNNTKQHGHAIER